MKDPCGPTQPMVLKGYLHGTIGGYFDEDYFGSGDYLYGNDKLCQWHIEVDVGSTIQLTFKEWNQG